MLNEPMLGDLRLFCEVARRLSFVAAAHEFGNSQTHVSKRIALLEKTLGVKLLHRTTRRVSLTTDGETVNRWARAILQDVDAMRDDLSNLRVNPRGSLRMSSSQRLGRSHIAPIVSLMKKRYPELEIWLELVDRRVNLVEEGFDLDIRVGAVQEPGLIAHHIAVSPRVLCAAPHYLDLRGRPKSVDELAQHDCLVFRERDEPFGVWRLLGPGGWSTVKVTGPLASNHSDVVLRWARDGHGIVMVGQSYVAQALADGTLERVLPAWEQPADVWAMSASRAAQSAKVRVCIDFLKQELAHGEFALWKPESPHATPSRR
ncbi:LysR family transcriptional regulator [Caballeronia cordobensis]|uniref:LysR family transcriptional regulator n=3 Tax=Caballeronia cordobensis TaxID=1353886 RepID=A0A158GQE5_CABCO|nr:LysR family transcriptional regulator [Caballeronia cordobensis]